MNFCFHYTLVSLYRVSNFSCTHLANEWQVLGIYCFLFSKGSSCQKPAYYNLKEINISQNFSEYF